MSHTVAETLGEAFDLLQDSPTSGSSAAGIDYRMKRSDALQNFVKVGGHGLRSSMQVYDLGSTYVPQLVLGREFSTSMAKGLQKASELVPALFDEFQTLTLEVYHKVSLKR